MDKHPIELQAKLDEAKSKNNINADIAKLEKNLDKIELQVEIDPKASDSIKKEAGYKMCQSMNGGSLVIHRGISY